MKISSLPLERWAHLLYRPTVTLAGGFGSTVVLLLRSTFMMIGGLSGPTTGPASATRKVVDSGNPSVGDHQEDSSTALPASPGIAGGHLASPDARDVERGGRVRFIAEEAALGAQWGDRAALSRGDMERLSFVGQVRVTPGPPGLFSSSLLAS
ncbi:hypothetical protein BHE74_00011920 [Ensete ventricosum]|nr:hypothetical protein BHE74_00011920 [Ensete ventricosum]